MNTKEAKEKTKLVTSWFLNADGNYSTNFFEEILREKGDIAILGIDFEFNVHTFIIAQCSETLERFVILQETDEKLVYKNLRLPTEITFFVAIKFLKSIYSTVTNHHCFPDFKEMATPELYGFIKLCDIYCFISGKKIVRRFVKYSLKRLVSKFYGKEINDKSFQKINLEEKQTIMDLFFIAIELRIKFSDFFIWMALFFTSFNSKRVNLKTFRYIAKQRPDEDYETYNSWGNFFFLTLVNYIHISNKNWSEAKEIEFDEPDAPDIIFFNQMLKTKPYRHLRQNYKLLCDVFTSIGEGNEDENETQL